MWFLYKLDNENRGEGMVYCRLRPNKTYSMGRKGVDIMLYNDKSISKHHASIRTDPMTIEKLNDINDNPRLYYTDNSSKYGTRINDHQVTETTELSDGDVLALGSFGLKLRVQWVPFVLCRQGITSSDKRNLFLLASSLGVHIVNVWSPQCTHLLVTNFTATGKVLHCLVDAKPIITPEWLGQALHTNDMEFDPATEITPQIIYNYGPLKKDAVMGITEERKKTFAHKVLYFFEQEQFLANQYLVEKLGGVVKMKDLNRFDTTKELLNKKNQPILIEPPSHVQEDDAWVALGLQLSECDIRVVPEYEIGYAIIYGSSHIACNPKAFANHIEMMEKHHHHQQTSTQPSLGNFTFDFSLTMASFQNDSTLSIEPSLIMQSEEPSEIRAVKEEPVEHPSLSLGSLIPQPSSNKNTGSKGKETASQRVGPGPSTRRSRTANREDDDLFSDIFSMRPSIHQQSSGEPSHQRTLATAPKDERTLPFNEGAERTIPFDEGAERTIPFDDSAERTIPFDECAERTIPYNDGTEKTLPIEKTLDESSSNMDQDRTVPYEGTTAPDNYPSINMNDGQDDDFDILDDLGLTQTQRPNTRSSVHSNASTAQRPASTSQRDTSTKTQEKKTTENRTTTALAASMDDDNDDFDWLVPSESTQDITDQRTLNTQPTTSQNVLNDIPSETTSSRRSVPASLSEAQRKTPSRTLGASLEAPSSPPRERASTPITRARQSTPFVTPSSLRSSTNTSPQPTTRQSTPRRTTQTRNSQQASTSRRNRDAMMISPLENEIEEENDVPAIVPGKRYMVVEFAPLKIIPRPTHTTSIPSHNGVNVKRFKKVHQFQDRSLLDVVNIVSSTQREREEERREVPDGAIDPDIFIRSRTRRF